MPPQPPALVLLADDDPAARTALSEVLAADGLDVAVATGGNEVLEMVAGELPDLILLDGLPCDALVTKATVKDGVEVARRTRRDIERGKDP